MSLAIDIDEVEAVLIGGQWFQVLDRSFDIDSYEYLRHVKGERTEPDLRLRGGQEQRVSAAGFCFTTMRRAFFRRPEDADGSDLSRRYCVAGPLTAIQAVRMRL